MSYLGHKNRVTCTKAEDVTGNIHNLNILKKRTVQLKIQFGPHSRSKSKSGSGSGPTRRAARNLENSFSRDKNLQKKCTVILWVMS